jgi:asparagine synthase (glutamine-hydrolysing)
MKMLPSLVKHYEEPYADSSALPSYYVSKLTRDHVTVALNGDGGDENFGGYGRYSVQKFGILYNKFIPFHKHLILPITKFLAKNIKTTFFDRVHIFAETLSQKYNHRYVNYIRYFSNEMKADLYTKDFKEKTKDINSYDIVAKQFNNAKTKDKTEQAVFADFTTYLPDDLMVKVDIASMTVALEGRSPFLDHEFLELTAQIPFNLKLKGLNNKKYILKEALRGLVPNEVMFRPKMGFGVPIDIWFREELRDYAYKTLLSKKALARGLFQKEAIENLLDEHMDTKISHAYRIWE